MVDGHREHVEHLREEIAGVLSGTGLRLSAEKTSIIHIDEGFDFLGFRIQRNAHCSFVEFVVDTDLGTEFLGRIFLEMVVEARFCRWCSGE